ncbi:A/G-specific adenine glycosylase [Leptolyngbya sp. DQ-M1]|uniref:A/G-specific adenine glycosylase n=1 Tax=Leptolyngbya sp. DQ-M1 TaxID=2933920 RepID=UPI003298E297
MRHLMLNKRSHRVFSAGIIPLPSFAISELRSSLLSWYAESGRSLPWREIRDPYAIWVSEIMLQQTQVKTVIPYFDRWMKQFPTIESLANADLQTVLKAWEGLGYYARARNFHRAAQQVLREQQGQFPTDLETVLKLPGIGRTTAGGILSAAFNQPLPILDGNVKRVLARLIALEVPPSRAMSQLWEMSEALIDPENGRDFNQALMDLGATVCTPKNPACLICPWRSRCEAYNRGVQTELPMSETRAPLPHKMIGVAVIWNEQRILIDRRKAEGLLGGLWEFPGGKVEPGETIEQCIKREIQEELSIEIEVGEHLITVDHTYTHFRVTLNVHHCRYVSGEPQPIECEEIRWVTVDQLPEFPFPKANIKIIEALKS